MQKILFLLFLSLISCSQQSPAQARLDARQTEQMLQSDPTVQLVDLRTPAELQQTGKIEGARPININSADFQSRIAELDKTKPVILYCAAGTRSARAAAILSEMGFKKVFDYSGGMSDWQAKGKKTVR